MSKTTKSGNFAKTFGGHSTMRSSGAFSVANANSPFSTPFYLVEEKSNKYRIDERLKQTVDNRAMIPFLRTNDEEYKKIVFNNGRRNMRCHSMNQSAVKFNNMEGDYEENHMTPRKKSPPQMG